MDDDKWGFVVGALGICTTVDDREFELEDLERDACIQWRAPYRGSPTINFGGVTVHVREEICRRYMGDSGDIGTTCGMDQCLNPQHFSLRCKPCQPGVDWEHLDDDDGLLLRTALWAQDPPSPTAPGAKSPNPERCLLPSLRLYYEMMFF